MYEVRFQKITKFRHCQT